MQYWREGSTTGSNGLKGLIKPLDLFSFHLIYLQNDLHSKVRSTCVLDLLQSKANFQNMQHFQNIFQKHALQIARRTINQIIMKIDTCHVE